jgi:hypothetical protein
VVVAAAAAAAAGRPSAHAPKARAQELQQEEERPGAGGASPRAGPHRAASPGQQQPALATALCSHTPAASEYELSLDLKNKQVPRASQGGGEGGGGPCLWGLSRVPGISLSGHHVQAHLSCHWPSSEPNSSGMSHRPPQVPSGVAGIVACTARPVGMCAGPLPFHAVQEA